MIKSVYFLTNTNCNAIKIGYSSKDVHKRIKQLNTGSPEKIYLLAMISYGTKDLEKQLHKRFQLYKKNLEWFNVSDEILNYINQENDSMVEIGLLNGKLMVYKKMKIVK